MKKVRIYTNEGCGGCQQAKEYLRKNGIDFEEREIGTDESARKELEAKGIQSTPVLEIGGETVVGFDPGRIEELLKAA
ncbi:MAG: glutaredoxin family protein [Thermodesulfobacteriota bacterium]